ncbi:MAG: Mur ligase family protein, partial [Victivallales bacterium]|nr:Mur ligase family protein [Victivallales bacterium]
MAGFTIEEIISATGGVLRCGDRMTTVTEVLTDSRRDCTGALFIPLRGETFDGHDFLSAAIANGAAAVLTEPGKASADPSLNIAIIEVENTTAAYQDLACWHRGRFPRLRVAAVTGSSGKTSTKEMLRAIFNAAVGPEAVLATEGNTNNQVGVPQNLLRLGPQHRLAVVEMGTNHHGEIAPLSRMAAPDVTLITFIGNCHLEFLGSQE